LEISSRKRVPRAPLDLANRLAIRSGERPSLVTEQLALEQHLGDGSAIHGDEGIAVRARWPGEWPRATNLLAGTGFAYDEHAENSSSRPVQWR